MFPNYDAFKETLQHIAERLNNGGIVWCIGASSSLFVQGVAVQPKDIDIIVDSIQFDEACQLLKELQPGKREEGEFSGEKYYKIALMAATFPTEVAGFSVNTSTLVTRKWEDATVTVHPLDYELKMYKQRAGKEHIVTLIKEALEK